jgi:hypothetical protein
MKVRTLEGDDEINRAYNDAMAATIQALETGGIITVEQAKEFLDNNVCMMVVHDGGFMRWARRMFGEDSATTRIVVARIL